MNDLTKPLREMMDIINDLIDELDVTTGVKSSSKKANLLRAKMKTYSEDVHGIVSATKNLANMIKTYRDKQQMPVFFVTGAPNSVYPVKVLRTYKEFHLKQFKDQEYKTGAISNSISKDHSEYIKHIDFALCAIERANRDKNMAGGG